MVYGQNTLLYSMLNSTHEAYAAGPFLYILPFLSLDKGLCRGQITHEKPIVIFGHKEEQSCISYDP